MEFSPNLNFPCPSPEDYGAIALYMQRLAFEIEEKLNAEQVSANLAYRPFTDVWKTTAIFGPISSSGILFIDWLNNLVFRNYTLSGAPRFGGSSGTFPAPGVYHMGFFVNTTTVGAANADSFRRVDMKIQKETNIGSVTFYNIDRLIGEEGIAGGNFFGSEGVVIIDQDYQAWKAVTEFTHGNTSSDMNLQVGALAWRTYLGTLDQVTVT